MKRIIALLMAVGIAVVPLWSNKIVESELSKGRRVRFVNYRGRYTRIMPLREIRSIGIGLGNRARRENIRYRRKREFSIIRARGAGRLFNADIFHIDRKADIVDIKSIRIIIGAYLERKYGYSEKDGLLLAKFVTFYNAVYRGRVDYFRRLYNPEVMRHLTRRNAGMSRFYYYWPGRSRILIPLSKEGGKKTITRVNPSEISGKKVIDNLRKRKDRGVKDRRKLLEIKDRENRERKKRLDRLKKKQAERERKLREDRRKLREDRLKRDRARKRADKIDRDVGKKKDRLLKEKDPKKQRKLQEDINKGEKKLVRARKDVKKLDDAVKKRQKTVDDGNKKTDDDGKKIKKLEKTVRKNDKDNDRDRKLLKKDEKETGVKTTPDQDRKELERRKRELARKAKLLKEKEQRLRDRKIFKGTLYYLKVQRELSGGHYNNVMMLIDPINRKVLLKSSFADICGRKYDIFSGGAVVIGHKGGHANKHFLVLLDHKELKPTAIGNVDIYFRSFVEIRDGSVYAVYKTGGSYRVGRFDAKMQRVAGSEVAVSPDTFITFYEKYLYIQSPDKGILVLDRNTLKQIGSIRP